MSFADGRQTERERIEALTKAKNEKAQKVVSEYQLRKQHERDLQQEVYNENARQAQKALYNPELERYDEPVPVPWIDEDVEIQKSQEAQERRIKELEGQVRALNQNVSILTTRTDRSLPEVTQCSIEKQQAEYNVTLIHRSIGWSNRFLLCGLTGNVVMGPVAGYLTDNLWILLMIEIFAIGIAGLGLIFRPARDDVFIAEKERIRSTETYSAAVIRDTERQIAS